MPMPWSGWMRIGLAAAARPRTPARKSADVSRSAVTNGQRLYESRCIGCHSLDSHRVGPAHRGVFGRQAGTAPDYAYSDAVKDAKLVWTTINLDRWLSNPEDLIPGQKMGYSVSSAQDRADLIAFLMNASAPNMDLNGTGD